MGNVVNSVLFPAPPPSYTHKSFPSPPLHTIDGVPCLYFSNRGQTRGFMVYLHGNSTDLGRIRKPVFTLARDLNYTVIAPEYPGYGIHYGETSPESCILAALRVLRYAREHANRKKVPVVLCGRSIGTGIVSQIARRHPSLFDHLVLISPFESIERLARKRIGFLSTTVKNVLNTGKVLKDYRRPILIIHGQKDTLIPIDHAIDLYNACPSDKKTLRILHESDHDTLDWASIIAHFNVFVERRGAGGTKAKALIAA